MTTHSLGVIVLALVAFPIVVVALMSVVTLFLPARHPEEDERFKSGGRIKSERRKRRVATHW